MFAVMFGLTVGSSLPGITAGMIAYHSNMESILAISPTVMFLISVLESFLVALLYNQLVPD